MILDEEKLKELKNVELDIFKSFIDVCEKLNIKWYVIAGTLLGTVRHKGFIPWDDDIDIGIMREDYEKFLENAQKYLPNHLFLQTYKTDKGYQQPFAKIRNTETAFIETSIKDNKMNHGVFIDVFPLDFCNKETSEDFLFNLKKKIYSLQASYLFSNIKLNVKQRIIRLATKIFCFDSHKATQRIDKLHQSMPEGKMLANFSGIYGKREIMPIEWYSDGVVLKFEGIDVKAPKEYDKWLTQVYGDYMQFPPVEKRVTHHLTEVIDTQNSYKNYFKEI